MAEQLRDHVQRYAVLHQPARTRRPGDEIFTRLLMAGAEGVHLKDREDLELGRARQAVLVVRGERIAVDGLVAQASLAAARRQGFVRWQDVPAS